MKCTTVTRQLMFGALVIGLVPLAGAGVEAAAAGESPASLCRSTFGDRGPAGGPVVGEGPSGDPMSVTIGWDTADWPDGLREIVTCVSVAGRSVSGLTTSTPTPRNDGSLALSLTLPPGAPGALVCQQSVLVGAGDAAGQTRPTSPVCFKLRAAEPPLNPGGRMAPGPVSRAPAGAAAPGAKAGPPSGRQAPAPGAKAPVRAPAPSPYPASTPPARAAFEAARGGVGLPVARPAAPGPTAAAEAPAPAAPAAKAGRSAAAAPGAGPRADAAVTALPRTGLEDHIPLAGAGGFLALGGAAIILGAPRRRRP